MIYFVFSLFLPLLVPGKSATTAVNCSQVAVNQLVVETDAPHPVYQSFDHGITWWPVSEGLPDDLRVSFMAQHGEQVLLATENHGLYISERESQRWRQLDTKTLPGLKITSVLVSDGVIYAGVFKQGIFASYDHGLSWETLNSGLQDLAVRAILKQGDELWVGADNGIYSTKKGSGAWKQIFKGAQVNCLHRNGTNVLAATHRGIVLTINNGQTWNWVQQGEAIWNIAPIGNELVAMHLSEKLEKSSDNGMSWQPIRDGLPDTLNVFETVEINGLLVCSNPKGVYLSYDNGGLWVPVFLTKREVFVDIVKIGNVLFAGTVVGGC